MWQSVLAPLEFVRSSLSWAKRRLRTWGADRQRLLDETVAAVTPVQDFLNRATPLAASAERVSGEIRERLDALTREWQALRPRLLEAVNRHPSDKAQRLGGELVEDIDKLLLGLRYFGGTGDTDVAVRAAASESVHERHEHAVALVQDLLNAVRAH